MPNQIEYVYNIEQMKGHLEQAVEEMAGDLLGVLDADVREEGRVATDVGEDERSVGHGVLVWGANLSHEAGSGQRPRNHSSATTSPTTSMDHSCAT